MKLDSGYFIGGDFHYFRVPREDWRRRLELLKGAGANYVSTYIPWMLHEPAEGEFHFSDNPKNDLDGFLTLCAEMKMDVIAKPGPYQYSELRWCGLPAWLCEGHPEIMAQDKNGKAYNSFAVSYLHPLYLEKVKRWYDAVLPVIAKYQKSRGGTVDRVQIDNEMCFHEWFGGWDYHREVMGWGSETGRWAEFQKRHKGAEYHDFYFSSVAEFAKTLVSWIRSAGIDCGLVHNIANPNMVSYFRDIARELKGEIFLGVDMYYNLGMDWEANNPTPQFAANAFLGFEELRLTGFAPTVMEMQAGNCVDWPPTTPENLTTWHNTCLALGMKGVNWYVFTGGANPPGIGGDGDIYDYRAAVGPDGEVRPTYYALKEFTSFTHENAWLVEAEAEHDYYLALDWAHPRGRNDGADEFWNPEAWMLLRKGVLFTGLCASRMPRLTDLAAECPEASKPLIVCSTRKMPRAIQENVVKFLKNGGSVLIAPTLPEIDEHGDTCTILRDYLGAGPCERLHGSIDFHVGDLANIADMAAFTCALPDGATQIAENKVTGCPTGWEKALPEGGKVVWLGLSWRHSKNIHLEMFDLLMSKLNASAPVVACDNPYVWAVLRTDGKRRCLFVLNLHASPMEANVTPLGCETMHFKLAAMETKMIVLDGEAV